MTFMIGMFIGGEQYRLSVRNIVIQDTIVD